jgi:hypothetical protein
MFTKIFTALGGQMRELYEKGDVEWVQAEIETSEKLAFCRHVIRYLGTGKRESEKKIRNPEGKIWTKSQNILHIYTEFARYVDLEKIVQAHVAKSQYVLCPLFCEEVEC